MGAGRCPGRGRDQGAVLRCGSRAGSGGRTGRLTSSAVASSRAVSIAPPCAVVKKPLPMAAPSPKRTAPRSEPSSPPAPGSCGGAQVGRGVKACGTGMRWAHGAPQGRGVPLPTCLPAAEPSPRSRRCPTLASAHLKEEAQVQPGSRGGVACGPPAARQRLAGPPQPTHVLLEGAQARVGGEAGQQRVGGREEAARAEGDAVAEGLRCAAWGVGGRQGWALSG